MKRVLRTLILCILVLSITASAFACGKDKETSVETVEKVHFEGTHIYNQTDTGKYIVKDGVTDYKVVVPNTNDAYLTIAKDDLVLLFKEATGIELELIIDNGNNVNYTEDSKYISLGNTSLVEQANISPDEYSWEKLGDEGVRIITKGNTIFLLGANVLGICYSVTVLYELMFNFEAYHRTCIYIDRNVTDVPLMNYDVTDLPDVKHGEVAEAMDWFQSADLNALTAIDTLYYGNDASKHVRARGARAKSVNYSFTSLIMHAQADPSNPSSEGGTVHNVMASFLNPKYQKIDSKWKSDSGTQPCYTAHGDSESLEAFVDHVVNVIQGNMLKYPRETYPLFKSISMQCTDGTTSSCMCEACTRIAEMNNGAYIASHIMFVNKVNEKLQPWIESLKDDPEKSKYYRPDFQVQLFAYGVTVQPPVYFDEETGEVTPCTDEVVCAKGTNIFLVAHRGFYQIYDDMSKEIRDYWKAWSLLTPNSDLWLWSNSGNHAVVAFYDNLAAFDNDFWEMCAYYDFDEAYIANHFGNTSTTSFLDLAFYVGKKLRWNCHLNMNELINNFMTNMYGDAAGIMSELYEDLKVYWYGIKARLEARGEFSSNRTWTKELWPVDINVWWYGQVEKAVNEISYLKEIDETEYKVMAHRIRMEEIAPLFNLIELHGKGNQREITDEQLIAYKKALYEVAQHHPKMAPGFNEVTGTILERAQI